MRNKKIIYIIIIVIILIIGYMINRTPKEEQKQETTRIICNNIKNAKKTTKKAKKSIKKKTKKTTKLPTSYKLTHYGWDCKGCGGKTATGYNIKKTTYYNDYQYGKVRIVAMCSSMPLYSIIKIKNYKFGGDVIAIVLDRGVGCGTIDLAVKNEKTSYRYGIQKNVKIEILRRGR